MGTVSCLEQLSSEGIKPIYGVSETGENIRIAQLQLIKYAEVKQVWLSNTNSMPRMKWRGRNTVGLVCDILRSIIKIHQLLGLYRQNGFNVQHKRVKHWIIHTGRDLWRTLVWPTCSKQGQEEQVAHSYLWSSFEYFQGWNFLSSLNLFSCLTAELMKNKS